MRSTCRRTDAAVTKRSSGSDPGRLHAPAASLAAFLLAPQLAGHCLARLAAVGGVVLFRFCVDGPSSQLLGRGQRRSSALFFSRSPRRCVLRIEAGSPIVALSLRVRHDGCSSVHRLRRQLSSRKGVFSPTGALADGTAGLAGRTAGYYAGFDLTCAGPL
jgi:hypothetical protein